MKRFLKDAGKEQTLLRNNKYKPSIITTQTPRLVERQEKTFFSISMTGTNPIKLFRVNLLTLFCSLCHFIIVHYFRKIYSIIYSQDRLLVQWLDKSQIPLALVVVEQLVDQWTRSLKFKASNPAIAPGKGSNLWKLQRERCCMI